MPSDSRMDDNWLRDTVAPGKDCLAIEDLGLYLEQKGDPVWRANVKSHVASCANCSTELRLMQEFQSDDVSPEDADAVRAVSEQLDRRSAEIFRGRPEAARERRSWWKQILGVRWLTPAAVAVAGVLVIAGVGLQLRQGGAPTLHSGDQGQDVLRSSALTLTMPVGDIQKTPDEVAWQAVAGAARYQVKLFEVDRTAIWQTETAETRVALPPDVRARIVPAKTLLFEVVALDASNVKIADSEMVRFRLLPVLH